MPKLLLAVDSATIRRVLELTFSGSGIDVITAADGEQAIARIPVERPDVVLADIALPPRSGYDVAAFIKGDPALSHIRVLLLAGAFDPVDEARAASVPCDGVLAKPFEPPQVLARVKDLLARQSGEAANAVVPLPEERLAPPPPLEFPRRAAPAPAADATAAGSSMDHSLNEYFAELDAAFDSQGDSTAPGRLADPLPGLERVDNRPLPTVDRLIGGGDRAGDAIREAFDLATAGDPPAGLRALPTPPRQEEPQEQAGSMADAFAALLAYEEGDRSVAPVRVVAQAPAAPAGEDMVEEVVRRVVGRLAPGAVKDVVAEVVADVAERLVREEIARIRNNS